MVRTALDQGAVDAVEQLLTPIDELLEDAYPGETGTRQPVHTVYVPGDQYHQGLASQWGAQARQLLADNGGPAGLLEAAGVKHDLQESVGALVEEKLRTEPIEDMRIDFEDGYGEQADEDTDVSAAAEAVRAGRAAGTVPPMVGIRIKSLERKTRPRGIRTLDVFISTLVDRGTLPDGLVLTLAKVSAVEQVEAMVMLCDALERSLNLRAGLLRFEIQIETPQAILDQSGTVTLARMVHAGHGRVRGLHFGTFDYSSSLGIAAAYHSTSHPAAEHAKELMQVAVAGTGVQLSDGSTNVVPTGSVESVHAAWANHSRLVTRSLERGFYQGWDMHPGHLPSRFAATYAFFREHLDSATRRIHDYLARRSGSIVDEPATLWSLARFVRRGIECGAVRSAELQESAGVDEAELESIVARSVTGSS